MCGCCSFTASTGVKLVTSKNIVHFPKGFNELIKNKTIHFLCHVDQGVGHFYLLYAGP